MLGFDNDDEEYLFHRNLSLGIIYLSPVVVSILMGFSPPTYGKHVTVGKSKQPTLTEQEDTSKQQPSTSSATGDDSSNSNSLHESTSLLRKRRGPSLDDNSQRTSLVDCRKQKQQKEQRHWLGPLFPARWSWVFFESPCWIWVVICLCDFYWKKDESEEKTALPIHNQILLGWFSFHYLYRSLWYPLVMMKTTSARIPFGIIFFAWSYCCVNGYLQARELTKFSIPMVATDDDSSSSSQYEYQFWLGVLCTLIGFYINFTSDRILQRIKLEKQQKIALRQMRQRKKQQEEASSDREERGASRYAVPYGGFFEYVSSPHYFGELMEWTGFCIANDFSLASFSFVVWTAANLVPRAIHTHKWYNETFVGNGGKHQDVDMNDDDDCDKIVDYSQLDRKVIIPFIF